MDIIQKSLNYFKSITAETVSNAKSGHTGSAVSANAIILSLFHDHLKFDATGNNWPNRDRFVLSAGHTSAMFYTVLHMFGYDITMDDLKHFRTCGSKTPGHPELHLVPGAETTTGPLGQGVANAVGMAIAETKLNRHYPDQINHYTYCYAGDGCLMEGVAVEACSLAGTLKLNKLILLYDDNNITIDGQKTIANAENVKLKFEAMGWNTIEVKNGHNYYDCSKAISKAKKSDKPTIILFKTVIGLGTSKEGSEKSHAYPLPAEELEVFKQNLGVAESFYIPDDVYAFCREATYRNNILINNWNNRPDEQKEVFERFFKKPRLAYSLILKELSQTPEMAGRDASSIVFNELNEYLYFLGGTADVGPSTKAVVKKSGFMSSTNRSGRNIHFGIREHAMGSVCNGIALYGGFYAFDSTFMAFSNYMLPALKMRSMMQSPVLTIFTHDSVDIGEDGPTHQPIEQIGQLRSLINYDVFRPATYAEVVAGYKHFIENKVPTALVLSKNKITNTKSSTIELAECGGYVIFETKTKPQIEIISTGRDVYLAIEVAKNLENVGARVISMPCESVFAKQDKTYKNKVRLKNPILRVAIEASNDNLWYKYVGEDGLIISVNDYQTSGKGSEVYANAGFNANNILKQINKKLK